MQLLAGSLARMELCTPKVCFDFGVLTVLKLVRSSSSSIAQNP